MPANFNSDMNISDIYYNRVVTSQSGNIPRPHHTWSWRQFKWKSKSKWNGCHHSLPTTDSPTISACTTSTNLSSLEFQSNSTINSRYRGLNLERNLRRAVPEMEPLQAKKDGQIGFIVNSTIKELDSPGELSQDEGTDDTTSTTTGTVNMGRQLITAIAVSWVSMVVGYISAYTSPATVSLQKDLSMGDHEVSWMGSLMPLMACFGGLLGGPLIEYLGRKWTLLVTDVMFLAAWMINYFAYHYWFLYVSRMIAGCSVGIASLTLPVYLGETIQPEVRGSLGLLPTALGNVGILTCFLLGMILQWKGLAGVGALLPLPFLILIWFIPETPHWYISKGKIDESRKALEWLRGKDNKEAVDKEFDDLLKSQKTSDEKNNISDLFSRTNIKSLSIALGLMFFQQMSGINAIIFYTTSIFNDTGSKLDSSVCTTIVGVVNFISTFIATVLIDKLGRKALLYISSVSMIVTLAVLGTYFYLLEFPDVDIASYGWLPLASFVIYVLGFSLGFGPIPWLMMGEILPAKIRGPAASVATAFNWTCTFVVTKTFPLFKSSIGPEGTFWMFGCITVIGLVFTILFVPETRGQSLEDIERKLAGVRVRRMSSVANLKPLQSTF